MRIVFHEKAKEELIEAVHHYEERALGLGHAFLDQVEKAIEDIQSHPYSGGLVGDEIRSKLLGRFPYRILYAIDHEEIIIIAIAHHKRRPGYWHPRT